MADAFRGLTLRLGADARPVQSALSSISRSAGYAQKQLNKMNKALRFDSTNLGALRASIDLADDKAQHMARSLQTVKTAMKQAAGESAGFSEKSGLAGKSVEKVAGSVRNVYAATQKLRAERTSANAELQHIYDGVKRVYAGMLQGKDAAEDMHVATVDEKNALAMADKYVKSLQRGMSSTGEKSKQAFDEVKRLLDAMDTRAANDLAKKFGLEGAENKAKALYDTFTRLHSTSGVLKQDLEAMLKVEGFRALRNEAIAAESALREAVAETVRLKAETAALGSAKGLPEALAKVKSLSAAVDAATNDARAMRAAYEAFPTSVEAARSKIIATRNAQQALNEKVAELRTAMAKIESSQGFDKMAASTSNVRLAFEKAKADAVEFGSKVKLAEERVKELEAEMTRARAKAAILGDSSEMEKLEAELREAGNRLSEMRTKADAADEALDNAARANKWQTLNTELAETSAQLSRLSAYSGAVANIAGTLRTMGYGLYSTVTPAILMVGRKAIQSADDVDSAYRDMRKTVSGTEEQFEHLRQAALEFGRTHVTSADQILEIEAIGGQLGIASTNLEHFSEVVSNLDIATNMDTETISENLGQLSNIMNDMNQDWESGPGSLEAFSDALVRLGNNSAAQEDKIMKVMMRIASIGTISGMTTPDLLALSTAVAAAGQGSEAAGTALSRTFSQIEKAVGDGGDKLKKFAEVSGMSASEFAEAWKTRPMEAFQAFIVGLKDIDDSGGSVANTLSELSINAVRQRQTLMNLTNTTDVLSKSLDMSNTAWNGQSYGMDAAGDAAREAQRKSEGFSGQLQILKNAAQELGVTLLDSAVPMLKSLTSAFQGLSAFVSSLPDGLKTFAVAGAAVAAALGPMLVAIGATADGFMKLRDAAIAFKGVAAMTKAMRTMRIDMAANTAALAENEAMLNRVTAAQERRAASGAAELPALARYRAQLEAQNASLKAQRAGFESASAGAKTFKTVLSGIGKTVGFMVLLEIIGHIVGAITEAVDKAREMDEATKGLERTAKEFSDSASAAANGMSAQADATSDAIKSINYYENEVNGAVEANKQLADSIASSRDTAASSSGLVDTYAKKIIELAGNCDGVKERYELLNSYVESFNQLTGSSVKVIDEQTGKLNVNAEALGKTADAFRANAFAEAAKSNFEAAAQEVAKYQAIMDDLVRQRDELKKGDITANSGAIAKLNQEINTLTPTLEAAKNAQQAMDAAYVESVEHAEEYAGKFGIASASASESVGDLSMKAEELGLDMEELGEDAEDEIAALAEMQSQLASLCEAYPSFSKVIGDSGIDVQHFSKLLDDMGLSMDDVVQGVENMANKVADGFNRIEAESEVSLETYMDNLKHNIEITEQWGDNLKELYDRSSDETYQAWVKSIADAGPEYAGFVAEMNELTTEELMDMAGTWGYANEIGPKAAMDSMQLTSEDTLKTIEQMASGVYDALQTLNGLEIAYEVTDDGSIQVNMDDLDDLDRKQLAEKSYVVTDDGKVVDLTDAIDGLNMYKILDKTFYVSDDGTIVNEKGEIVKLQGEIDKIPEEVKSHFSAETTEAYNNVVELATAIAGVEGDKWTTIHVSTVGENAIGGILPAHATGAAYSRAIRAIPRHAAGAINGIVTRPAMTNVGLVGEAGAEAILNMRHAGGAIVPLTNRRYVRPFARAVASEMGAGGRTVNVTVNLDYKAGDDAEKLARGVARRLGAIMDMGA